MFLIGESHLDLGCGSGLKKVDCQSRVIFMYDNLTDISDIASLPAGLFSTLMKLSVPFLLNLLSPLRNIFMHLNVETREIISEFPFIVSWTKWGQLVCIRADIYVIFCIIGLSTYFDYSVPTFP